MLQKVIFIHQISSLEYEFTEQLFGILIKVICLGTIRSVKI